MPYSAKDSIDFYNEDALEYDKKRWSTKGGSYINNLQKSISSVRNQIGSSKKIELEVDSLESAMKAINLDIDIILLDNMQPEDILKFMNKIKSISQKIPLTEASGGITMSNLQNYASTGVDIISMGSLTHSSKSLDFSLQII